MPDWLYIVIGIAFIVLCLKVVAKGVKLLFGIGAILAIGYYLFQYIG